MEWGWGWQKGRGSLGGRGHFNLSVDRHQRKKPTATKHVLDMVCVQFEPDSLDSIDMNRKGWLQGFHQ